VTSNNDMPNVLLAIPPKPNFARHPVVRTLDLDIEVDAMDAARSISPVLSDKDLLAAAWSGASSAGIIGSAGAMVMVRRGAWERSGRRQQSGPCISIKVEPGNPQARGFQGAAATTELVIQMPLFRLGVGTLGLSNLLSLLVDTR
jgi:hypothetical protein